MTKSALMWVFNSSIGIGEAVSLTGSGLLEFSVSVSGPCSVFSLSELEGVLPLIEFYPLRVSPDFIVRNCGALAQLRWVLEYFYEVMLTLPVYDSGRNVFFDGGSYPSSVIAGLFSGRWRLSQIHRRRLEFPGRGDLLSSDFAGSWLRRLRCGSCRHDGCAGSVVCGFLLADDISKNSMKLSALRLRVEEKFGFGGGSPYLSSDETRCTVVVLRRCSDAAMVKSRHR
ncbi:hypothetical protein DY000_02042012 [Brassica cretica]|uniref:Uncharacterized protein n=1 Tax=Brassica cretica TaxID=69181 RepID=A0ABQ7BIG9_BRACR|nr:hypothetical protein DY000_02042012 [Brassica cretica]